MKTATRQRPIASLTHTATERLRTSRPRRQLGVLPPQPRELGALGLTQLFAGTGLTAGGPILGHPVAQRPIVDTQLTGDLRDRLTGLPHDPDRTSPELGIELPVSSRP